MATIFNITQVFINVNSEEASGSRRRPLQGRRRRRRKKHLKTKRRQEKGGKLKINKGGRARGDSREETSSVTSAS